MNKDAVVLRLGGEADELRRRFGVEKLFLFGSVARGNAGPGSDVDLLVEYEKPPGLDGFLDLADYLEASLGVEVDLVTLAGAKPKLLERIREEMIRVA